MREGKNDRTLRYHTQKKLDQIASNSNNNNQNPYNINNYNNLNKKYYHSPLSMIHRKHKRAQSTFEEKYSSVQVRNNFNNISPNNFRLQNLQYQNQKYRNQINILNKKLKDMEQNKAVMSADMNTLQSIKKTAKLLNYRLRAESINFQNLKKMLIPENMIKQNKISKRALLLVLGRDPFNIQKQNFKLDFCNYLINDRNSKKNKKEQNIQTVFKNFEQIIGPYNYIQIEEQNRMFCRIQNIINNNKSQMNKIFRRMSEKDTQKVYEHIFLQILSKFGFTTDMLNLVMMQLAVNCQNLDAISYQKFFEIFQKIENDNINSRSSGKNIEQKVQFQEDIVEQLPEQETQTITLQKIEKERTNKKLQNRIQAVIEKHNME